MDPTPFIGIICLIALYYLGRDEEAALVKLKAIRRASLVNIRGIQAEGRLHRLDRIHSIQIIRKQTPLRLHAPLLRSSSHG